MLLAIILSAPSQMLVEAVNLFARAGGGGSGGDGGSGGGGGIVLVGYVPMHIVGALLRRTKSHYIAVFDVLQVLGWIIAVAYAVVFTYALGAIGFFVGVGSLLGMGAGLYGWFGKVMQSKQTKQELIAAAQKDRAWDEATLLAHAKDVFTRYQQDWSNYNTESMKAYMTPSYQYHAALMVYALQLAARVNTVQNPVIIDAIIVDIIDLPDKSKDQVVVGITAKANDMLIDTRDKKTLFIDTRPFTEFWRFNRSGDNWLLDGIQQSTASRWLYNNALERFAAQHGYYFSLDWGWLLLPRRGQLFRDGKFGTSDINNHVIGMHGQCLVQLYTYCDRRSSNKTYLIAQANVPKTYGDIVVRHKKRMSIFGIRGLKRVSTEWPDFNKKYDVFASDVEQVTSLELLNPTYMEKLEALPFEVNIEVVDNVVYLYAPLSSESETTSDKYELMLSILNDAFNEMRL